MISVLFVDDEPVQLALGKTFLERTGNFTVDTLGSAEEVLASENLEQYDAIVSDYQMPDTDGITLLQEIRSAGNTVPFIIFTGKGREETAIQALNGGADFYVRKGLKPESPYTELGLRIQMAVQRQRDKIAIEVRARALQESEEKYRSLADSAEDLIYILDRDDHVTYVNRFGLKMLNKSFGEVVGRPRRDLFSDIEAERQYQIIRQVFASGLPVRTESCVPLPCGMTWQDTQLVPIRSENGTITAVMGISRDITGHRNIENALRENLERYHQILKNAHEGILVFELTTDGPGKILDANEAACRILGVTSEELHTIRFADIDIPELKARFPDLMRDLWQDRHIIFQIGYRAKDGEEKIVEVSASLFEHGGRPTSLAVIHDITLQMKTEDALRRANKKLGLLTGITRHDIRNQLLALNGYLLLSQDTLDDAEKTAEYIRKEEGITEVIEHQIAFTQQYENLGAYAPVWQNVEQCIRRAARDLDLAGVGLSVTDMNTVEIFADSLLQKVFFNLVDNSLRHGGDALGQIRFSCQETENGLVLICDDDGSGIPAARKEMIFELGYGKNSGFGLFFIREILGITGIIIRECGTDTGARFEIIVPKGQYRFAKSKKTIP
ncbi:MAG: PAS domain S-box protein [Methanoregula sp.]|jgi:PAS domain S-box-containing protein